MSRKAKLRTRHGFFGWSITDGRKAVGRVEISSGKFTAIDPRGRVVGKYPTLHEAVQSFKFKR
jgi:hypothetical protein